MPLPQGDWATEVGNRLIAEQCAYNREEQTTLADEWIPTLNEGQQAAFTAIFDTVESGSGQTMDLGELEKHMFTTLYVTTSMGREKWLSGLCGIIGKSLSFLDWWSNFTFNFQNPN